jgi:IS30 family transposase
MSKSYTQLSFEDRVKVDLMRKEGKSMRAIATALGRSASTISRELARNSRATNQYPAGYEAQRAEARTHRRRRWDARFKLSRDPQLRAHVRQRLEAGFSPEIIAGELRLHCGTCVISHEAIYRFIYHRSEQKDHWHKLLPRRKSRRGRIGRRGLRKPLDYIPQRVSIHERPAEVDTRSSLGHWEGDLMCFSRYGPAILITHERASRLLLATRQRSKAASPIADQLLLQFKGLPHELRRTLTFDNGGEFSQHHRLKHELGMATYFCDPHSPWQKGGIENAIGRMRRRLPRETDLESISTHTLNLLIAAYNHTPRKCLGYQTPAQAFCEQLNALHFNREFTSRLARE